MSGRGRGYSQRLRREETVWSAGFHSIFERQKHFIIWQVAPFQGSPRLGVAAWVNSMHGPASLNYRLSSFVIAAPPTGRAPSAVGAAAGAKHWL